MRFKFWEEMSQDGQVMNGGSQRDEYVPDGVSEGNAAVRLEEEHAGQVQHAAQLQVVHRRELVLENKYHTLTCKHTILT